MPGRCYRIFAVVIIPCFLVLAVRLGDIAVHTLSAAWAFQDTGQDVCVVWIVNLFPLKRIDLALFLCQIPILFGNDMLMAALFPTRTVRSAPTASTEPIRMERY